MMPKTGPKNEFLVLDAKTDKVLAHFEEQTSGMAFLGYPVSTQRNSFVDEKGDIYFITAGLFSMHPMYKSGIIRIKKGEYKIDPTYNWVINDQEIPGESMRGRWLVATHYAGNGILYAYIDIPSYWENPAYSNWLKDRSIIAVEMNIYTRTIKKLPIPRTCAYATNIASYHDKILFSS